MGDPELYRGEQVLLRTPGVYIKSIPFEGILTNMRIILVDRAKNILPTKEVAYDMIQEAEIGENAIGDLILTLTVQTATGENRQMILTFSQREGGNRMRERDEWVRIIQDGVSAARGAASYQAPPAPQRVQAKRVAEPEAYERPAPAPQEPVLSPGIVFCSKCGNRVLAGSAFCNKCGTPIVAPAQPARQAPPPVQAPAYEPPAPKVSPESFRTTQPQAPRPAVPLQQKPAAKKKGFLSGLFGGKKKQAAPAPRPMPSEAMPRRSRLPVKKILVAGVAVIVVIAVLAIGALVVLPMLSSGGSDTSGSSGSSGSSGGSLFGGSSGSTSGTLTNTGVASITVKETTAPTVPVTGVWVLMDYVGSYSGKYGMTSDLQTLDSSGSRLFEIVNASGTVQVIAEKKDSSTKHELSAAIYKDGKLLKSGSTKDSYGKVSISADTGISPVSTATTTAAAGNTTTTVKTTATTKTTAKTTTKST